MCPSAGVTTPFPTPRTTPGEVESKDTAAIVGGILGGIIAVLIIVGAIVFYCRTRAPKHKPEDDYLSPVPYMGNGSDGSVSLPYRKSDAGISNSVFSESPPPYEVKAPFPQLAPSPRNSNKYDTIDEQLTSSWSAASASVVSHQRSVKELPPNSIPADTKL